MEAVLRNSTKSVLLLGPRQTGKSTLIQQLKPQLEINLAHEGTFLEFARNPYELEQRIDAGAFKTIFVDEIQKLPSLLNTIQTLIDNKKSKTKFYLTGSSARKLKRGQANLLPGRIHAFHLGGITAGELQYKMDTMEVLSTGTLPGIIDTPNKKENMKTLQTYAAVYLKEEIQAESLLRDVQGFSRLLFILAAESGKFLGLSKLCTQVQMPAQTASRYFEILEETLIIRRCDSFAKSERKRLIQRPKFFFFDTGVLNGLLNNFTVSQDRIGILFEHLIFNQIMDSAAAADRSIRVSSYRTEHGAEVDFIIELEREVIALEVKASSNVGTSDLKGLKSFADFFGKPHRPVIAYMGSVSKKIEGVMILPWQKFLKDMIDTIGSA